MTKQFGIQLTPSAEQIGQIREIARLVDREGLDLIGVQDHPYAPAQLDAFGVIAMILADTERVRVFPDVADLPLRGAAVLANAAASLDVQSGGRFELGLGSGGYPRAIASMGGPMRSPGDALAALDESIGLMRTLWRTPVGERVVVPGTYAAVDGMRAGPAPAHPIGIWVGSIGPRSLALTGRVADGWAAPIPHYLPYEEWPRAQDMIDAAARDAGRDPSEVIRMAQLVGDITATDVPSVRLSGEDPIRASADQWVDVISDLAVQGRFDTFVYWPENPTPDQASRWVRDVVPAARTALNVAVPAR